MNNYNFKPFQQVLVRSCKGEPWCVDIFSNIECETTLYVCVGGVWQYCIPYEGNENLLGTTNEVEPKRWRAEKRGEYYFVCSATDVVLEPDLYIAHDNDRWEAGNYFRTKEEAKAMAEKFKKLLKGEMVRKESEK